MTNMPGMTAEQVCYIRKTVFKMCTWCDVGGAHPLKQIKVEIILTVCTVLSATQRILPK